MPKVKVIKHEASAPTRTSSRLAAKREKAEQTVAAPVTTRGKHI